MINNKLKHLLSLYKLTDLLQYIDHTQVYNSKTKNYK